MVQRCIDRPESAKVQLMDIPFCLCPLLLVSALHVWQADSRVVDRNRTARNDESSKSRITWVRVIIIMERTAIRCNAKRIKCWNIGSIIIVFHRQCLWWYECSVINEIVDVYLFSDLKYAETAVVHLRQSIHASRFTLTHRWNINNIFRHDRSRLLLVVTSTPNVWSFHGETFNGSSGTEERQFVEN